MTKKTTTTEVTDAIAIRDVAPKVVPFGKDFIEFAHKGKSFTLDRAVLIGGSTKRLMPIKQWLKATGGDGEDKEYVKCYNKCIKPAFYALCDHLRSKAGECVSVGVRVKLNGDVSTSFRHLLKAQQPEAPKQIADGTAKRETQSKQRAKRQRSKKPLASVSEAFDRARNGTTAGPVTVNVTAPTAPTE